MDGVLAADMARAIHQLGLQSMRASVVDLTTMSLLTEWSINEAGQVLHGVTG